MENNAWKYQNWKTSWTLWWCLYIWCKYTVWTYTKMMAESMMTKHTANGCQIYTQPANRVIHLHAISSVCFNDEIYNYNLEWSVWLDVNDVIHGGGWVWSGLGLSRSRGIFLGLVSPGPALKGSGLAAFGVVLLKGLMNLRGLSDFVPYGWGGRVGEREGKWEGNQKGDSMLTTNGSLKTSA